MYEFEKHPKLTEFVLEMASSGKAPQEWTSFIETLNQALRIHDVIGQSEQFKCDCGCANRYKNEIHDSVMCADCGTVYARI